MPMPQHIVDQIVDALKAKREEPDGCPICGEDNFSVGDYVFNMPLSESLVWTPVTPVIATHVLVHCTNCGLTYMVNINILGITEIILEDAVRRGLISAENEAAMRAELALRAEARELEEKPATD
jgi:hypothetical protein